MVFVVVVYLAVTRGAVLPPMLPILLGERSGCARGHPLIEPVDGHLGRRSRTGASERKREGRGRTLSRQSGV